jgi:hypothetical protein
MLQNRSLPHVEYLPGFLPVSLSPSARSTQSGGLFQ